jgi:lantibiotic modifying enzyme
MTAPKSAVYLQAAIEAARWIRSAAVETPQGLRWLPEPDHPEKTATVSAPSGIYSGSAGIVLFFLQMAKATGDTSYLNDAKRGADYLAATWRDVLSFSSPFPLENISYDFSQGLSGIAFVLAEAWRATGVGAYRDAALEITRHIAAAAKPAGAGVAWVDLPSAGLGDGAIVLYLLWAAKALNEPVFREVALRAGERILERGQPDPRGGKRWPGLSMEAFGAPKDAAAPNFEMGTAGVAFVLARLYAESLDQRYLDAAEEAAKHVQALATVKDDAALLYYREPDHEDLYYLGFCHGPVGTARPFYELYQATHDREYLMWTDSFARGIMQSGIPEQQTPGLWNVVCQCCGTAGIADFFVGLWAATQKPEYLAFAERVADHLAGRATNPDGKGYRWYQAWTRVEPDTITAETGYMIGAAGVGAAFLHLYLAEQGKYEAILFPDNPFPHAI